MKRTFLRTGAASIARGSTFKAKPKPLDRRATLRSDTPLDGRSQLARRTKPLKARKPVRKVNPERRAKKAELQWGPGGSGGVYATLLRARPSDATGRGGSVPRRRWHDLERLAAAPQSVFAHVRDRGMGGVKGRWFDGISLTDEEHRDAHNRGWGNVRGLALLLAHALAWAACDAAIVPAPECERPDVPKGVLLDPVTWYGSLLRVAWPERHNTEEGGGDGA